MIQQAIQVTLTSIWVLFASPIAAAITPEWWYGLGAALCAALVLVAFFFLPETKYERPLSSFQERDSSSDADSALPKDSGRYLCTLRPELDYVNYAPRTWRSDLRLWVGKPDWLTVLSVLRVGDSPFSSYTCIA